MKVPVYAHRFASVPSKWIDVPWFLAEGWTGDVPEHGGRVVPDGFVDPLLRLSETRGWMQFAPPVRRDRRFRFLLWRITWSERIRGAWAHLRGRDCDLWNSD